MTKNNLQIVIAGPGAGKTHNMIGEILEVVPEVKNNPHRICAIITYTNAATEEIKERLEKEINIPKNIFIGTSHSFLIQFIIEPYSHLFREIDINKNYIDSIVKQKEKKFEFIKVSMFAKHGIITYDKVLQLSQDLIEEKRLCNNVAKRVSHLFVDEYQDMHSYIHYVLQEIIQKGKTKFYSVGDPLQSIFKFSYGQSQIRIKKGFKVEKLDDSPILKLKAKYPTSLIEIKDNNRSTPSITKLISRYTDYIGYQQISKIEDDYPIYFIDGTDKKEISQKFYNIKNELGILLEPKKIQYLHLSQEWKFWDDIRTDLKIAMIDKGKHKNSSLMSEIKRYVLGVLGMTQKQAIELIGKSSQEDKLLSFRTFCINSYRLIKTNGIEDTSLTIKKQFTESFGYKFPNDWKSIDKNTDLKTTLKELRRAELKSYNSNDKYYSTIHSSKGLEATSVLVCVNKKKQLFDWLNFEKVKEESDTTRLGFVAFSRARKLLCISCLEKLTVKDLEKIRNLEFKIEKTM
ncbi:UvrD-helicase domain-containing protein [Desulfobacula sp.]|uniref:UvrD-helicase domain-containing protein n=1 Tax=Desulfobacula sp. TaxID=2593537 RepID=UPI0025BF7113|nr:UvrD-helicase domain-containing protein [Desulfobacula sp.]MBC2703729.1 AAA family ATPase [Desulfobacula sp.]